MQNLGNMTVDLSYTDYNGANSTNNLTIDFSKSIFTTALHKLAAHDWIQML